MPNYSIEKDGKSFTVEAPDQQSAIAALGSYSPQQPQLTPKQQKLKAKQSQLDADASVARGLGLSPGDAYNNAATAKFLQGPSFGFSDEIMGGMVAAGTPVANLFRKDDKKVSDTYKEVRDRARNLSKYAETVRPKTALALEAGGGLMAGGASLARMGALKSGAAYGGAYGAGTAEGGLEERVSGSGKGAAFGLATGYGLNKVAGPIAANLFKKAPEKLPLPNMDQLRAAKDAAYRRVDDLGAQYSPEQVKHLFQGISDEIPTEGLGAITSRTHPTAQAALRQMSRAGDDSVSLSELDKLRQLAGSASVTNPADGRMAGRIRANIDEFVEATPPQQGGMAANQAIQDARLANSTFRKSELIDDVLYGREIGKNASGSGGNTENSQRQAISAILKSPKKRRGFSNEEIAAMERVVRGTPAQNAARLVGKLSPEGNGLMVALGIGGAVVNPKLAIASGAGFLSKRASERMGQRNVDDLVRLIRTKSKYAKTDTKASKAVQDQLNQAAVLRALAATANVN